MQPPPCTTIEKVNKMVEEKFSAWAVELLGFFSFDELQRGSNGRGRKEDEQLARLAQGYGKHLRENQLDLA